ncbi:thiol reductant ABC exporter subunit CydD [uncultured Pseudacidovorax sp.]|uniref:thiol reductant ABC exporter subunit CydD n=1 Tax=uncultured Pseudacidovorax sp. TaxID=679313 RepID=UPI0025E767ED|nr:thiol reductant ABC exporter subunit CydD [uncultured Pseudacidovorax sp.]
MAKAAKVDVAGLDGVSQGALQQAGAALLWLPQAACVAWAVQALAAGGGLRSALLPALGLGVLGLLRAALEAWGVRRASVQARRTLGLLRAQAAQALAARSPLDRARPASGLAASVLAEQAEAIVPWLARFQPVRLRLILVPPAIALAVGSLSWAAAAILLVAAPLIPLFMALVGRRAQAASEAQLARQGDMNAFLLDRLRGLATLRALDAIDPTAARLRAAAQDLQRRTMAVLRIAFLSSAVLELFAALGVAMVAVYVGFHLLGHLPFGTWGRPLGLGQGLFILLLAPAFFEPLRDLSAVWHDRAAGEAARRALAGLGEGGQPMAGAANDADAACADGMPPAGALGIQLRGLRFAHEGEAPVIDGLDLDLRPGEHLALLGASGGGKSTLLALLAGLAVPQAGQVRVGGLPMDGAHASALRQRIGWMGQRPHVFGGALAANVGLGRSGADAAQVERALAFAGLGRLAADRPAASLGEGGAGLSGGEAVRLALARLAVHADAGLLLVDEPTAHLDAETARAVTEALLDLARGRTLVLATHDPRLAARMDRVLHLGDMSLKAAA